MQRKQVKKLNSVQKLLIGIAAGIGAAIIFGTQKLGTLSTVMLGWDAFGAVYLTLEWITIFSTEPGEIRQQASRQDPRRTIVFSLILVAAVASVMAIILMIVTKQKATDVTDWRTPIAILAMILSWFLVHTLFTLRYAHIFYGNDVENPTNHAGGLDFPDEKKPGYLDFAYFSFVLGMTFQVSDVEITSRNIRKLALLHGLISFGFTTVILAIVINVMS